VLVAVSALILIVPAMLHWRRTRKIDMPDKTAGA
jgi:putative tricarboxylic transport membrane protein